MTDQALQFQTAIFDKLSQDATLISLVGDGASPERARVFSHVPHGAEPPYVTIFDFDEDNADVKGLNGVELDLTIHVWDRTEGNKATLQIMSAIYDALHDQTIAVTGGNLVLIHHDFATNFLDGDLRTWHGVTRFRALIDDQ